MAASKLLLSHLRRRPRPLSSITALSHLLPYSAPPPPPAPSHALTPFSFGFAPSSNGRFFSTRSNDDSELLTAGSATGSEYLGVNEVVEGVVNGGGGGEDPIFPVQALISLLDGYHDLTGLPWWIVIASSTVAMRVTVFPLLVLQLHKLKKFSELFPKLPPPVPPPLSGKSYIEQFSRFNKERRALGCPSFLWFFAYLSVQVPCFFLWVIAIRKMSLDHYPGFESGGTLWFENLTECPHGVLGPIFPLLIAGLHYLNVQLSFGNSSLPKMTGLLGLLARYYKFYLDLLTLPLFFIGYCIPQGSLIYWVTNSSLSVIQQLFLKNPSIHAKLGLPDKNSPPTVPNSEEVAAPEITSSALPTERQIVPAEELSPKELVAISVQHISSGQKDNAFLLLNVALKKDPDNLNALILMGQTLMQKELHAEAIEYFERALPKLQIAGHPTEAENLDLLILTSQWAGVACIRQGKNREGIAHLERIAKMEEPVNPTSKLHYFTALIFLGSILLNEGQKAEAIKHMGRVVAYNPDYKELLEQIENDDGNILDDLVNSRRRDY